MKFFKAPEANAEIARLQSENEELKAQLGGRPIQPKAKSDSAAAGPPSGELARITAENARLLAENGRLNAENARLAQAQPAADKTSEELWAAYSKIEDLHARRQFYLANRTVMDQ